MHEVAGSSPAGCIPFKFLPSGYLRLPFQYDACGGTLILTPQAGVRCSLLWACFV